MDPGGRSRPRAFSDLGFVPSAPEIPCGPPGARGGAWTSCLHGATPPGPLARPRTRLRERRIPVPVRGAGPSGPGPPPRSSGRWKIRPSETRSDGSFVRSVETGFQGGGGGRSLPSSAILPTAHDCPNRTGRGRAPPASGGPAQEAGRSRDMRKGTGAGAGFGPVGPAPVARLLRRVRHRGGSSPRGSIGSRPALSTSVPLAAKGGGESASYGSTGTSGARPRPGAGDRASSPPSPPRAGCRGP